MRWGRCARRARWLFHPPWRVEGVVAGAMRRVALCLDTELGPPGVALPTPPHPTPPPMSSSRVALPTPPHPDLPPLHPSRMSSGRVAPASPSPQRNPHPTPPAGTQAGWRQHPRHQREPHRVCAALHRLGAQQVGGAAICAVQEVLPAGGAAAAAGGWLWGGGRRRVAVVGGRGQERLPAVEVTSVAWGWGEGAQEGGGGGGWGVSGPWD